MTDLDKHQARTVYTATGLPPGLTVDEQTGVISGTPTVAGSYVITITETAVLRWPWSWLRRLRLTRGGPR